MHMNFRNLLIPDIERIQNRKHLSQLCFADVAITALAISSLFCSFNLKNGKFDYCLFSVPMKTDIYVMY